MICIELTHGMGLQGFDAVAQSLRVEVDNLRSDRGSGSAKRLIENPQSRRRCCATRLSHRRTADPRRLSVHVQRTRTVVMKAGDIVEVVISNIGMQRNVVVDER